jgi:hypothetical protein
MHLLYFSSIQYVFSLSSFPHLNLTIIFLSFALSLPRYSGISCVIHHSYFLLYLDALILSLLSYFSVSLSLSLSSTFIHLPFALLMFLLLHVHTRFSLSPSSRAYSFLSLSFLSVFFFPRAFR